MREKLRTSRGETLVEVLASVLVCSLSIMLLLGAVTASADIDLQAQNADGEYYAALTKAERQSKVELLPDDESDISPDAVGSKVTVVNGDGKTAKLTAVEEGENGLHFYGTERLLSYAVDKPEPSAPPGTGGGG